MNDEFKDKLTKEQYYICRLGGTEAPFSGKYNDFFEEGTYHCAACEALLFQSENKFRSGCGWPSFHTSVKGAIEYLDDFSYNMQRTEVKCQKCHSHLGHVFNDGPPPTHQRYCINSLSLEFRKK